MRDHRAVVVRARDVAIETLEVRQMLAATPVLSQGVLNIQGTSAGDSVLLTRIVIRNKDEVEVKLNGRKSYFSTAAIKSIFANLGDGADILQVSAASQAFAIRIDVDGGNGNDTLSGGGGNDTLCGDAGNDWIAGNTGNDSLEGGLGHDTIYGGKGDDAIYGNDGNDSLIDDRGTNTMTGGTGSDVLQRGIAMPPEFIIGVWGQPSNYAWRWKQRGVNTMVAAELMGGTVKMEKWDNEVAKNGMYMIRQPSANPKNDLKYKNLIAWMGGDEPDVHHTGAATVQGFYSNLKKISPDMPVFLNFSGGHVVGYQEKSRKHPYSSWVQGADWISNDIYPVAGWNLPDRLWLVGKAVDELRGYAPAKPQFAFIESSDQNISWNMGAPGPNPGQMRAEIWDAVIHGVRGIIYFADQFAPKFSYNGTPPDVEVEMIKQNARLKSLSGVLMSDLSPRGYNIGLPSGFEGTWRVYNGKVYFIVLNFNNSAKPNVKIRVSGVKDGSAQVSGENRSVAIKGGQITDSFGAYEAKVYVV